MQYTLAQSLSQSRASITSGAFLTRANVLSDTIEISGLVDFRFGVHQFQNTRVASATILVTIPQPLQSNDGKATPEDHGKVQSSTVKIKELLFSFEENSAVFYLVPRDSTLEELADESYLLTFLTLRKQPGGTNLQYQIIPVSLRTTKTDVTTIQSIRKHINPHAEVKEKMVNAMRHITKMDLEYLAVVVESNPAKEVDSKPSRMITDTNTARTDQSPATHVKKTRRAGRTSDVAQSRQANPLMKPLKDRSPVTKSVTDKNSKGKKQKKASIIPEGWTCELCGASTTVMRRRGPSGLNCACNFASEMRTRSELRVEQVTHAVRPGLLVNELRKMPPLNRSNGVCLTKQIFSR